MKKLPQFILLLTAAALSSCAGREYAPTKLAVKVEQTKPYAFFHSSQLTKAGDDCWGKVIQVSGRIQRVIAKGGAPVLVLEGRVTCGFAIREKRTVEAMQEEQNVTLKGVLKYTQLGTMGPYLSPCVILKPNSIHE